MTEQEKRDLGLLYDANYDPEIVQARLACQDRCHTYNMLRPSQIDERKELLRRLLGKTGERFWIEQPFWCDYGTQITLGEDFYANHNLQIIDAAKVTFGDHVFIAPNCGFYTAGHPLNPPQRNQGLEYAKPITVGNNVWIGAHVVVLPGVTIGDNTVIGAGSVVCRDIPSGVVAVGNPCKVVRVLTAEELA
ncbi:MAG: sugar O-acetyltransferase [Butyricicoccus sp.]|nr:sugar O-acetyltransferase [Butyricicoccus sp.]